MRDAATLQSDERVLRDIQGKDIVALEVKYHRRCYEKYTSSIRHDKKVSQDDSVKSSQLYEPSFKIFCEQFILRALMTLMMMKKIWVWTLLKKVKLVAYKYAYQLVIYDVGSSLKICTIPIRNFTLVKLLQWCSFTKKTRQGFLNSSL